MDVAIVGRHSTMWALLTATGGQPEFVDLGRWHGTRVGGSVLQLGQRRVLFVPRYGDKRLEVPPAVVPYKAIIEALFRAGVHRVIGLSSVGAIARYSIGEMIIPDDFIDFTSRYLSFFDSRGSAFVRMNPPFCPILRQALIEGCVLSNKSHRGSATYICVDGPRYETPSEIRMFAHMGADVVGMTVVPEAILSRERAMCYAALCFVTNYAEGTIEYVPDAGTEGLIPAPERTQRDSVRRSVIDVLTKAVESVPASRSCLCKASLEEAFLDSSVTHELVRLLRRDAVEQERDQGD